MSVMSFAMNSRQTSAVTRAAPDVQEPTTELIRDALADARELVRIEIALAREELKAEAAKAKTAAIAAGAATTMGLIGSSLLFVALALALPIPWLAALLLGAALVVGAGVLGFVAWRAVPKRPLGTAKDHVEGDIEAVKETVV